MKVTKLILTIFFVCFLVTPSMALVKPEALVIGENLKPGMALEKIIQDLGIPKSVRVNRGTDPQSDSIVLEYKDHGVRIYAFSGKPVIEGIEILPSFRGKFKSEKGALKLNDGFDILVRNYGMPKSLTMNVARYPNRGLYFLLTEDDQKILSAKVFVKDSRLLQQRLANPMSH